MSFFLCTLRYFADLESSFKFKFRRFVDRKSFVSLTVIVIAMFMEDIQILIKLACSARLLCRA